MADSTERLASGKRNLRPEPGLSGFINRLDSQMRGMNQAKGNVEQAFGFVDLAGARLDRLSDITSEIRSLALTASSDEISSEDRALIEEQAQSLLDEFDNLVGDTNLGGRDLLTGAFNDIRIQVGANAGDELSFSLGDARSGQLGGLAKLTGVTRKNSFSQTGGVSGFQINGVAIATSSNDGISSVGGSYSSIAIANAINAQSAQTGVSATALATELEVSFTFDSEEVLAEIEDNGSIDFSGSQLQINGVNIEGSFTELANVQTAVNQQSSLTGVRAELSDSDELTFVADDGRNINIVLEADAGAERNIIFSVPANKSIFQTNDFSLGGEAIAAGGVELYSGSAFSVTDIGDSSSDIIGANPGEFDILENSQFSQFDLSSVEGAEEAVQILDVTIDEISTLQANVSAIHSRLSRTASSLIQGEGIVSDTKTALTQTDFALEVSSLAVAQLLQDSSIAALTQANVSAEVTSRLLSDLISQDFFDRNE